jgi:hypothetical protein
MKSTHNIDTAYFPGWTRKSLTFTIDDGNVTYDTKFLNIVRPRGIRGTFNLCSHIFSTLTPEGYRELYRGYEIANHCKFHPIAFDDGMTYYVAEEEFDPMTSRDHTPDDPVVYASEREGIYRMHHHLHRKKPTGWYWVATDDYYLRYVDEGKRELEEVFGEGSVRSYVFPCFMPNNAHVLSELAARGYYGLRKTGDVLDTTGFDMPADRMAWSYNAHNTNLLDTMDKYEKYPDDGKLKFFAFGVHSGDFETCNNWDVLETFAAKYGSRPEDYYYASVGEIFDYEDANRALIVTDEYVENPSEVTLYIKVDGERIVLDPHEKYILS